MIFSLCPCEVFELWARFNGNSDAAPLLADYAQCTQKQAEKSLAILNGMDESDIFDIANKG